MSINCFTIETNRNASILLFKLIAYYTICEQLYADNIRMRLHRPGYLVINCSGIGGLVKTLVKYLHSLEASGKSDRTIATRKGHSFLAWVSN
jgi:hypothetical protein